MAKAFEDIYPDQTSGLVESSEGSLSERVKNRNGLIVALDGNIGVGKSTCLMKIYDKYVGEKKVKVFFEPAGEIDPNYPIPKSHFLDKFYENPKKYAFTHQLMLFQTRINTLMEAIYYKKNGYLVFMDRCIIADMIFQSVMCEDDMLTAEEVASLGKLLTMYNINYGLPENGVDEIFLFESSPSNSLENCQKRNHPCEKAIGIDYLIKLEKNFSTFYQTLVKNFLGKNVFVTVIDVTKGNIAMEQFTNDLMFGIDDWLSLREEGFAGTGLTHLVPSMKQYCYKKEETEELKSCKEANISSTVCGGE